MKNNINLNIPPRYRKQELRSNSGGFTIVELMIATLVFSLVLLVCAMAIVHVGRMYYKGTVTNRTQDTARRAMDDIARNIQFGASSNTSAFLRRGSDIIGEVGQVNSICLGNIRYTYSTEKSLGEDTDNNQIPHVLWRDRVQTGVECGVADISQDDPPGEGGVELLGANMRIPHFDVQVDNGAWSIEISISYGDDPLLFEDGSNFGICKGTNAGGQFCATAQLSTTVLQRL